MLTFQPVDAVALTTSVSGTNGVIKHIGHAPLRDDAFVLRVIQSALLQMMTIGFQQAVRLVSREDTGWWH